MLRIALRRVTSWRMLAMVNYLHNEFLSRQRLASQFQYFLATAEIHKLGQSCQFLPIVVEIVLQDANKIAEIAVLVFRRPIWTDEGSELHDQSHFERGHSIC